MSPFEKQLQTVLTGLTLLILITATQSAKALQCQNLFLTSTEQISSFTASPFLVAMPDGVGIWFQEIKLSPSGDLPKVLSRLPKSLKETLNHYLMSESLILLTFEHPSIGGFVASRGDPTFFPIFKERLANQPILALNTKNLEAQVVAHELVHVRDELSGVLSQARQDFETLLQGVPQGSQLVDLLVRYVAEYRAENETVFFQQDIQFIKEQYLYQSMILSAARVPDEIFGQIRKEFKTIPKEIQKQIKPRVNSTVRQRIQFQIEQNYLEVQKL